MKMLVSAILFFLVTSLASAVTVSDFEVYELGDDGFVVGWQTDEPSTSQVLYGLNGRLGDSTSVDSSLTTDHQIQIDTLDDDTVYFFRATGTNVQGEQYTGVIGVTRTTPADSSQPPSDTPPSSSDTIILDTLKAFPSAQGHGADLITGGKGGKIFYVTSLANSNSGTWNSNKAVYEGTLRYALSHPDPGYIIFRTAGVANSGLRDYYFLNEGYGDKTILGASAPYPGVIYYGGQVRIGLSDKNRLDHMKGNWIIRGLTFLTGKDASPGVYDVFNGQDITHVILSDNTFGWGSDESVSFDDSDKIIMQRNLVFENHQDHNTGSIFSTETHAQGSRAMSIHNNAYVHISHRFPNVRSLENDRIDIVNQFVYNWRSRINSHNFQLHINDINNYYKPGPRTSVSTAKHHWNAGDGGSDLWKPEPQIYASGSIIEGKSGDIEWTQHVTNGGFYKGDDVPESFFTDRMFPLGVDLNIIPVQELYDFNIEGKNIGARYYMNSDGERIKHYIPFIEEYLDDAIQRTDDAYRNDNSKFVLPSIPNSRDPYVDSDYDGMSDAWERRHGLTVGVKDHEGVKRNWNIDGVAFVNNAGYSNIEMFNDYIHGGFLHLIHHTD